MKRITLQEIEAQYHIHTYQDLYDKVINLIHANQLKPVISAGTNGKKPALYKKYWMIEQLEEDTSYLEELSYLFVPAISTDYYLTHKKQYQEDRTWLLLLNQYLKSNRDELAIPKSMNERSFDIWHREKFLKEEQGKKILKRCGISLEQLNLYETTEPLAYYVHTRQTPQNMLIVENKDTFYSMRKKLLEGSDEILGTTIGTLIYGGGKSIYRSFQDFSLCAEPYMRAENNVVLYFGDLDYEGILIYEKVATLFSTICEIKPFIEAYQKMLQKAQAIGENNLPFMKSGQNQKVGTLFMEAFDACEAEKMQQLLKSGVYIPQEILALKDL